MANMGLFLTLFLVISIHIASSQDHILLEFDTHQEENGQSRSYIAPLNVDGTIKQFSLATNAREVSMANCTFNKATFTLQKRPAFVGTTKNVNFKNVRVSCSNDGGSNVLGLAAKNTSFPYQITKAAKLPHVFAYCLGTERGELRFGEKGPYSVYYNTDILNRTSLPMHYFPVSYDDFFSNYKLSLQSVTVNSKTVDVDSVILIALYVRYTSLPSPAYQMVRENFLNEVAAKKLKKESAFGELDLCYRMDTRQMSTFSKVTLDFNGEKWVVTPDNYLAIKKRGVACFGFIDASHLPRGIAAIGTLMQENNFVEYDIKGGKLGVSGSLYANLGLTCSATHAT